MHNPNDWKSFRWWCDYVNFAVMRLSCMKNFSATFIVHWVHRVPVTTRLHAFTMRQLSHIPNMCISDTLSVITLAFCCGKVKNSSLACTLHSTKHTTTNSRAHTFPPESRFQSSGLWRYMRRYCQLNSMLFMRMNVLSINIFRIHAKRNPKRILQNQHIIRET